MPTFCLTFRIEGTGLDLSLDCRCCGVENPAAGTQNGEPIGCVDNSGTMEAFS